eukprot:CAMPEP_0204069476 /NCGR_PEP_ID=MMETSP0360-20130528/156924_1 /ASSEMBLY_ACC=CAM_ASM_000342 /TAXON_ID=268821 /ORGANISM="Scrippsiella Hangoei, Strain SHTV-5" /LENGTH=145 /DNA_ID=CAMNT_0051017645 /DNA_START=89 /DNA_END=523 /DNA_ORIENTATION=-
MDDAFRAELTVPRPNTARWASGELDSKAPSAQASKPLSRMNCWTSVASVASELSGFHFLLPPSPLSRHSDQPDHSELACHLLDDEATSPLPLAPAACWALAPAARSASGATASSRVQQNAQRVRQSLVAADTCVLSNLLHDPGKA